MKLTKIFLLACVCATLVSCQIFPSREGKPAAVKDASLDAKINPKEKTNTQQSVIEIVPMMNSAVKSLYYQAQRDFKNNFFTQAIASLERAYQIQPQAPEVSQLLAEIYLHEGDFKQAHYWATIATSNGPSKGKSCEKSWRILALAAEQLGYFANQANALEKQQNCLVIRPNRY